MPLWGMRCEHLKSLQRTLGNESVVIGFNILLLLLILHAIDGHADSRGGLGLGFTIYIMYLEEKYT